MTDRVELTAVHRHEVRIYYEDTDAGGIVYYANYLKFIERARTELLHRLGIKSSDLMDRHGVAFAVKTCTIDYCKPARLDDVVGVETEIVRVGGASLELRQVVKHGPVLLVTVKIKLGCLDIGTGKPKAIPSGVHAGLTKYFDKIRNDRNKVQG